MITTLTPNPAIDKTLSVPEFDIYKMNRARVLRTDFGGKGINVSAALKGLDAETLCLGFSFSADDDAFRTALANQGIPAEFIVLPGHIRTCTKIFDESRQHTIEVNEFGQDVSPDAADELIALLARHASASSIVTLSGSLPKGLAADFYQRCIRAVKAQAPSCKILVDAEKKLLLNALSEAPHFLKPNIFEFQDTFGVQIDSLAELDTAARNVVRTYGLEMICVSLGKDGAYITNGTEAWHCRAPQVTVRSIQGAGDSVIAGMCVAFEHRLPLPEILHYGVAAAGDSISREGTQFCTKSGMEALLRQDIGLEKLN